MKSRPILLMILIFSFVLSIIPIPRTYATFTVIKGAADADIDNESPDTNTGNIGALLIRSGDLEHLQRIVVKFDLSSIPAGSTINSAFLTLRYYYMLDGSTGGRWYRASRVTHEWIEGDNTNGVTWNMANHPTVDWNDGGEFTDVNSIDSRMTSPYSLKNFRMNWTVTDIVRDWIEGGQQNYGFIIRAADEAAGDNGATGFYSTEVGAGDEYWPWLEIDYTPPYVISAYATDSAGNIRNDFLTTENVYAIGSGFPPGVPVNIHIVNDRSWKTGDSIPSDVSSDGINSVITDVSGNLGKTLVWPQPTLIGEYDIIFDVNPNGQYDAGDFVDHPNHPGFSIVGFDPGSTVVGGFYEPVNSFAVLLPYIALMSLACMAFAVLVKRNIRKA